MDEEQLMEILEAAPWMPCEYCKEIMPFEILEIPNIGEGAACMNCGMPSSDTEAAIEQYEENLKIMAEIEKMYEEMGATPEEIMAWQEGQIAEVKEGASSEVTANMDEMATSSDSMYNTVSEMDADEFDAWINEQQFRADSPDSRN
jgi:hypothetical protein